MINKAHLQYTGKGGRSSDFIQTVKDGSNSLDIRIITRKSGKGVEVLTAHPIYR